MTTPSPLVLLACLALLLAAASAVITPDAEAAVLPVDEALAADVGKALATPGVLVVATWQLYPTTDIDKWIATHHAVLAAAKAAGVKVSVLYFKGSVPAAAKTKPGDDYASACSITSAPTTKDYAAWRAFTAKDAAYAAGQKAVKSVVRAINVEV